jgi:hypothetical protein
MSEALGFRASDMLKFYFLDPEMDVHRRNMSTFVKLAMGNSKPALRYWLVEALEESANTFFEQTRRLALDVERETGLRLDYLADRREARPSRDGAVPPRSVIVGEPLSSDDCEIALGRVASVFDAIDEQLDISLRIAKSNRFDIA